MFVIEQFDVGSRSAELRRTHGRETILVAVMGGGGR